tara:strand:- start:1426 stop:2868 length:1443 start_codon:yes stop_codon:yes gene_type:complete
MKRVKIQKIAVLVPILYIAVMATLFHFDVYYEDALTRLPAAEFGVKIDIWRVIFEPLLGPLLFFNRSLYALKELPMVFFWILIFYLIVVSIKIYKDGSNRRRSTLIKMANLPLLLGICFSIFVLILFIPLPNNTIVNNSAHSILVTTHAHTEFSHDGLISQHNMWKWHQRNGFDAFFITDHANHQKSLQFAKAQKSGKFPIDPLVMVGQEHSGSNHMSLLGLNGKFDTKGMSDKAVVDSVHRYGGAVIINHWFDGKGEAKEYYTDLGADGFEIENVGKDLYYDREIFENLKAFCERKGQIMIGGLDFHGYGRACAIYNALEIPGWKAMDPTAKERSILEILKNGPQEKIKVLMYKDRTFYTDSYVMVRPFLTLFAYFRTLNLLQVLSWIFWLLLFQWIWNRRKSKPIDMDKNLILLASLSALFLVILALVYHLRGIAVSGYSEVYSEYAMLLGPIGLFLLVYTLILGYFRFLKLSGTKGV